MKRCQRCVLPETFPGIRFDDQGICQYCRDHKGLEYLKEQKEKYRHRFEALAKDLRGKNEYDALMSYSGGKDSTFTLRLLKRDFGLNVLALTFDNGFLSPRALKNIQAVTDALDVDLMISRPGFGMMRRIFVESSRSQIYAAATRLRASTICTSCISLVKFGALRVCVEKSIPFNVFGWSPGQIPVASSLLKNNPRMMRITQQALYEPLHRIAGDRIRPYFLEDRHFSEDAVYPFNVSPLVFLDYDEEAIRESIAELGWEPPCDVDPNSTNCLINAFANRVHSRKYGYNPYVFELAKLVRDGYMDRREALKRLDEPEQTATIDAVRKKLFPGEIETSDEAPAPVSEKDGG